MKTQFEQSEAFNSTTEFRKIYDTMRNQILIRHGYKQGDKVKLVRAVQLLQSFNGNDFLPSTMNLTEMRDRIRMYESVEDSKVTFKLVAKV